MKQTLVAVPVCAGVVYVTATLLGLSRSPQLGQTLDAERSTFALSTAFPLVSGWTDVRGATSHTWLARRAFVEGVDSATGHRYSEQVLKVGWPFTAVRGFDRRSDATDIAPSSIGIGWAADAPFGHPRRLLPLQPVWPGVVTLTAALLLLVMLGLRVRVGVKQARPGGESRMNDH